MSAGGELVLLHGNEFRLRMLVNLVAELNTHGLYNALLLGFTSALCDGLRVRGRIGCAHSSYMYTGALAERAQAPDISPISPLYLPYISPVSPLYLTYISPISACACSASVGSARQLPRPPLPLPLPLTLTLTLPQRARAV